MHAKIMVYIYKEVCTKVTGNAFELDISNATSVDLYLQVVFVYGISIISHVVANTGLGVSNSGQMSYK